jgi:Flp pilus assembly protein TadD
VPLLRRATALPPEFAGAWISLGIAYVQLGRSAEAEAAYRRAIAIGGERYPGAHVGLGVLLLKAGRIAEACQEFSRELAVNGRDRRTRSNLMACRLVEGDLAGVVRLGEPLAQEDPRDANVLYNLALAHAGLGDAERARGAYARFLAVAGPELEPQRQAARRWLAANP